MLNEVGGRIWSLLDGKRDLETIISSVAAEFNEERETVSQDAHQFLLALKELRLLETG